MSWSAISAVTHSPSSNESISVGVGEVKLTGYFLKICPIFASRAPGFANYPPSPQLKITIEQLMLLLCGDT